MKRREQLLERLVDADPRWVDTGPRNTRDPNRKGIGISFECPLHEDCRLGAYFTNPLDGGPPFEPERPTWDRTGEDFESLTLAPSIRVLQGNGGCRWHGFIRAGRFETCGDAR